MQILISVVCVPPFLGWGAYSPEGLLVTCSYDYLKQEWNELTFMYYAFAFNYTVPMLTVIFFYIQIVKAVVAHEAAMKAQAKKMNVDSLKSNQKDNEASAEVKIAKVAITNVLLWIVTWTPYAIVAMIGVFGNQMLITPLVAQLPSFLGINQLFAELQKCTYNYTDTKILNNLIQNWVPKVFFNTPLDSIQWSKSSPKKR